MTSFNVSEYKKDPRVLDQWPADFTTVFRRRVELLNKVRSNPELKQALHLHYANSPNGCADFILDWGITIDPRNSGENPPIPTTMPFCLFYRQVEFTFFLNDCVENKVRGLVEKCRDMGASWVALAWSVWRWLYKPGSAIVVGSRKAEYVDNLNDPKCLFDKVRQFINNLPPDIFWPEGFDPKKHLTYMKCVNPENGATIVGESGVIGRGGRSVAAILDEASFLENPEATEAALADNTNCIIYISTPNGVGNVFHRTRLAGREWKQGQTITERNRAQVFVMDWTDHPGKSPEWAKNRREYEESRGMLHVYMQEVERSYNASVTGQVIKAEWVEACKDAHKILGWPEATGMRVAGMDVADSDGGDVNAMTIKKGYLVEAVTSKGGESDAAGREFYSLACMIGVDQWRYESTGVGAGARSGATACRTTYLDSGRTANSMPSIVGWSPSGAVVNPGCDVNTGELVEYGDKEKIRNKDYFTNARSQAWWRLRQLMHNTYKVRYENADIPLDECLSLNADMDCINDLILELAQPTFSRNENTGKVLIDKKPQGTSSPNLADSLMIAVSPLRPDVDETMHVGGVGADSVEYVAVG